MAVSTNTSLGISLVFSILIFSGLQMYKGPLSSTRLLTLVAGYTSSWLFIFLLTAVNNLETILFGKGFQAQVFPEVAFSLLISSFAAAMVHRVSITVCIICSMLALYYINKQSQSVYSSAAQPAITNIKKKK